MAHINKVCYNVDQTGDTTTEEKKQARDNIGASQISYDNTVTDMAVSKEIIRPYMNTKYSATIGSDSFLLLPSSFADGMVVKHNGSLETQSMPTIKNTHYISYINNPGSLSLEAYNEMTEAISNNEPVVIISATGSNASYLQFTRIDSAGHYFTGYSTSDDTIIEMLIDGTRAVTLTNKKLDTVPNDGTNGQLLTWNGSTYGWANKTVWQPGFNMTGRTNTSDTSSPYMDCNWVTKWGSSSFGSEGSTTADSVNEVSIANGQLTLEVTHKVRPNTQVTSAMYFRIKMNKTGAFGLSVFGDFRECNRTSIPDNYSFCVGVDDANDYVKLEHPTLGDVYFPQRSAGESNGYFIDLKCYWTNSKHVTAWANIQMTSMRTDINGFSGMDDIVWQYGTLTSSLNEV